MILFPAIDIKNGQVVRLAQGKFDQVTVYGQNPTAMAKYWQSEGAKWLHVVDLDGAQTGVMANFNDIRDIIHSVDIPVQVGGGIRTAETVEKLIDAGAERVVLGTKAIEDQALLKTLLSQWKKKIAVSVDCKDGYVTTHGWATSTRIKAADFVKDLEALGLKTLIYTDISRDGMLSGPNLKSLKEVVAATKAGVIASGGVSSLDDLKKLAKLKKLTGAITGKAIYEKKFKLRDANAILKAC